MPCGRLTICHWRKHGAIAERPDECRKQGGSHLALPCSLITKCRVTTIVCGVAADWAAVTKTVRDTV